MAAPPGTKIIKTSRGRSLVATRPFTPGELIATFDTPLIALPDGPGMRMTCNYCLRRQQPGGPSMRACTGCRVTVYCSQDCQRAHWKNIHKLECKMFIRVHEASGRDWLPTPTRAVAQVLLLLAAKDKAMEAAFGNGGLLQGNVDGFRRREKVWSDFQLQSMAAVIYGGLPETDQMLERAKEVLCKIQTNAFNRLDADTGMAGIFLDAGLSMVNHSCIPNAFIGFDKRTAMLRAQSPIPEGNEIEISYIDNTLPKPARQAGLELYHFECVCPACRDDLDVYQICAKSPVIALNKFSLRPDLDNLRKPRVDRSNVLPAKIKTIHGAWNSPAMSQDGPKVLEQRWKLCKSLTQAHMWAVEPVPQTILEATQSCQTDTRTFVYALPLACFSALMCDPVKLVAPFMPWRIKGMLMVAKLLGAIGRLAAKGVLVNDCPLKDLGEFMNKLDHVSMCEAVLRLTVHWGAIGAAADWDVLKEARDMLHEVEGLQGREKESALLQAWAKDPEDPMAGAFVENAVLKPLRVLAALAPSVMDALTGPGRGIAAGNVLVKGQSASGSAADLDMEEFLKEGEKLWSDLIVGGL
ncbi:hypothetical protein OQA88_6806 [Cercophora sp. LCS_1]